MSYNKAHLNKWVEEITQWMQPRTRFYFAIEPVPIGRNATANYVGGRLKSFSCNLEINPEEIIGIPTHVVNHKLKDVRVIGRLVPSNGGGKFIAEIGYTLTRKYGSTPLSGSFIDIRDRLAYYGFGTLPSDLYMRISALDATEIQPELDKRIQRILSENLAIEKLRVRVDTYVHDIELRGSKPEMPRQCFEIPFC